jgi:hypothetical protein
MAEVPISLQTLETIATNVSNDLLEKWAIEGRFTEEDQVKYAQFAVDDAIFVINKFMEQFNTAIVETKNV